MGEASNHRRMSADGQRSCPRRTPRLLRHPCTGPLTTATAVGPALAGLIADAGALLVLIGLMLACRLVSLAALALRDPQLMLDALAQLRVNVRNHGKDHLALHLKGDEERPRDN